MIKHDQTWAVRHWAPWAVVITACLPLQSQAQGYIPPLEQCEALYTVQKRECAVERVYRCDTPEGAFWRKDSWEKDDAPAIETVTLDGDFVTEWSEDSGFMLERIIDRPDPFSIAAVIQYGSDTFEVTALSNVPFFAEAIPSELHGVARRIGQETLDGLTFEIIRQDLTLQINAAVFGGYQDIWIDLETGASVNSASRIEIGGNSIDYNQIPAQIIRPGEPGFELTEGIYDCGELSQLAPPVMERKHL